MKKYLLFVAAISCVFVLGSCKSKSSAYKNAYDQAQNNDKYWEDEEEDVPEVRTTEEVSYESIKKEEVKTVKGEDDLSGLKKYAVVIGSFKNRTNAVAMKERMIDEGYRAIIAEGYEGWYRVIVSSFDSRADATRARDAFKSKYAPGFKDAWLLERKY